MKRLGKYEGMDRFECRKQIVKDLQEEGVLFKIEDHLHSVGHSERSGKLLLNHIFRRNGSLRCSRWLMHPLSFKKEPMRKKFISYRTVSRKRTCIGWKISATGASPVSFGGVTAFPPGTIKKQVKCMAGHEEPADAEKLGTR